MNSTTELSIRHAGRRHRVSLKPMPKGTIVRVHTADGAASAATSVRGAEPPEAAARWLLEHHRIFGPPAGHQPRTGRKEGQQCPPKR